MGARSLLLFVLSLVSARLAAAACGDLPPAAETCQPVTSMNCIMCAEEGIKIINPFDCHSFYICSHDVLAFPMPFECPDGEWFNGLNHECEPEFLPCVPVCASSSGCDYSCATYSVPTRVGDPYDCSIYYVCEWGYKGPPMQCPSSSLYFDGMTCQRDKDKCCHCQPYCYDTGLHLTADPTDCRHYFLCMDNIGIPETGGSCTNGQFYDANTGECSPSAPCNTLCPNLVDGDGCIDPFTCTEAGFFAKCPERCEPEYYHCEAASTTYTEPTTCEPGTVFNPDTWLCIAPEECPYPAPA